jgi:hypothetical protein
VSPIIVQVQLTFTKKKCFDFALPEAYIFYAGMSVKLECMEIYFQEISRGKVNFEVSIHDTIERNLAIEKITTHPPFFVFLTARDEASRKIWTTPVMSEEGTVKSYRSLEEAVEDATNKIH